MHDILAGGMEWECSMNDNQTGVAMTEAFPRLGRRLRLGLVGGGPGSFIGPVHRAAALLDRRFDLVAGVLSVGSVAILLFEVFIAAIQAFIFAILSAAYIGGAIDEEG